MTGFLRKLIIPDTTMPPSVSVVLPIYNEVASLSHVANAWSTYFSSKGVDYEFVFSEDGSTDGTKQLISDLLKLYPSVDARSDIRSGYGGGVLRGIKTSSKEFILFIDSDGQCMPDSFDTFIAEATSSSVQIGIRSPRRDPFVRIVYSYLFLLYFNLLFRSSIKDPSCPYILVHRDILTILTPYLSFMREGFWWGFVAACLKKRIPIVQHAIRHYPRFDGSTVVYKPSKMPGIILRNLKGLYRLHHAVI